MARDPRSPREWQEAVDAAEWCLLVDSARHYGLITGGPAVNVDRASEILRRGRRLGYRPAPAEKLCEMFSG